MYINQPLQRIEGKTTGYTKQALHNIDRIN